VIKNIIFDFGGVLINLDESITYDILKSILNPELCKNLDEEVIYPFEKGLISEESFFNRLQRRSHKVCAGDIYVHAWNAMILDLPKNRIDFIRSLQKKYRLFLLSNTNITHLRFVNNKLAKENNLGNWSSELFERAYFSHEIHCRKPDEKIYNYVLKDASISSTESLFIDDKLENVMAAEKIGLRTHHHLQHEKIELTLDVILKEYNS
jgi:putative hydrolase of the HAD superfamily